MEKAAGRSHPGVLSLFLCHLMDLCCQGKEAPPPQPVRTTAHLQGKAPTTDPEKLGGVLPKVIMELNLLAFLPQEL